MQTTYTYRQINYSMVLVQEQEHVNMSKNMFNGGNLRLHSVWKCRLNACTVWCAHVSKHIDNACIYRYHHCVSQYRQYQIFGIGISPSLVCVCVCSLIPGILSVWLEVGVSLLCSTGGCGCVCMCVYVCACSQDPCCAAEVAICMCMQPHSQDACCAMNVGNTQSMREDKKGLVMLGRFFRMC